VQTSTIETRIPSRLDRLPWSRFHWRVVLGLGTVWILDGLEVTIVGSVAARLTEKGSGISLSVAGVGTAAAIYVAGACLGALFFGQLTDRFGRKKLFMITLGVYIVFTTVTAFSFAPWFFYLARFFTGAGIGGEYAAINSAIDEMIPAHYRGRVDIAVNGTYWAGSILGTLGALLFLHALPESLGWRLGFLVGPALAVVILYVRRNLPESPRWLLMHGRVDEAERNMAEIEELARKSGHQPAPVDNGGAIVIKPITTSIGAVLRVLFVNLWRRSVLGASLMITQSFLYNAIFFTYTLVLTRFYGVDAANAPIYLLGFALGNLLGPLTIGRLFDTVGRKQMIAGTYILSGALLAGTAYLFDQGMLNALTQTVAWCVIFFFASAGASSAYLTVSEIFPLEVRAQAIAVFFAIAQCFGAIGPVFYGHLIGDGSDPGRLFAGYLIGAGVMVLGGIVEIVLGVRAERTPLESVAQPLSAVTATVPRAGEAVAAFSPELLDEQ
jgi:MFS family permease